VRQLVTPQPEAGSHFSKYGFILYPFELNVPGETGTLDESVLWDVDDWLTPAFDLLVQNRALDAPLWPEPPSRVVEDFKTAVEALGLSSLKLCRYGLRHGGASDDLLTKARPALDVKMRGHWKSDSSLKRYGKETRILTELNKAAPSVLQYGRSILADLPQLLLNQRPAAAPPQPPVLNSPATRGPRRR